MSKQSEALRLAEALDSRREPSPTHYTNQAAAELRRLHAENAELQRMLRLARAQLASHLQELVYSEIGQDGQVHDPDALLIIESEQDLINQIDEVLVRSMAGTAQEDA